MQITKAATTGKSPATPNKDPSSSLLGAAVAGDNSMWFKMRFFLKGAMSMLLVQTALIYPMMNFCGVQQDTLQGMNNLGQAVPPDDVSSRVARELMPADADDEELLETNRRLMKAEKQVNDMENRARRAEKKQKELLKTAHQKEKALFASEQRAEKAEAMMEQLKASATEKEQGATANEQRATKAEAMVQSLKEEVEKLEKEVKEGAAAVVASSGSGAGGGARPGRGCGGGKCPKAILHVGPHKTATTTFQMMAQRPLEKGGIEPILVSDGLAPLAKKVPGPYQSEMFTHSNWAFAFQDPPNVPLGYDDQFDYLKSLHYFVEVVRDAKAANQSVMITSEEFDRNKIRVDTLAHMLEPYFAVEDTTVILAHRRLHEWLYSLYFQIYRPDMQTGKIHQEIPLFWEWYGWRDPTIVSGADLIKHYKQFFTDIRVFNFHNGEPLPTQFFCALELNNTCEHLKKKDAAKGITKKPKKARGNKGGKGISLGADHQNKGFSLEYIRVIQQSILLNVTRKDISVENATIALETKMGNMDPPQSWTSFPLMCATKEFQQDLLKLSIEDEKYVVPKFHEEEGQYEFEELFEEFVPTHLCSVDVEKLMNNAGWRKYFENL